MQQPFCQNITVILMSTVLHWFKVFWEMSARLWKKGRIIAWKGKSLHECKWSFEKFRGDLFSFILIYIGRTWDELRVRISDLEIRYDAKKKQTRSDLNVQNNKKSNKPSLKHHKRNVNILWVWWNLRALCTWHLMSAL